MHVYNMGDIELLTRKVETLRWKKEDISLHAAAKQANLSSASKRCKCKGTCMNKTYKCRKSGVPCSSKCHSGRACENVIQVDN
jgi:hypothetical protein